MKHLLLAFAGAVPKVTHRDVGSEAGDERGSDGIGDGGVWTLGLLSCCSNDVKSNKGIETGGCALHHLEQRGSKNISKDIKRGVINYL